jgi:hypothetical protein
MEEARFYEVLVTYHNITEWHNPENNLKIFTAVEI